MGCSLLRGMRLRHRILRVRSSLRRGVFHPGSCAPKSSGTHRTTCMVADCGVRRRGMRGCHLCVRRGLIGMSDFTFGRRVRRCRLCVRDGLRRM